ncbi:MAG: hypothetical protein IKR60_03285, partial [Alphaproteobacteria bacterium]|nr:hypothetical protein [Alphaproteobacteria bacterium]
FLNKHIYTDLYEREYVAPESIEYTFPQKKRNLIVIYLESMEKDYTNSQLVGTNLLPNFQNISITTSLLTDIINCDTRIIPLPARSTVCAQLLIEHIFLRTQMNITRFWMMPSVIRKS